MSQLRLLGDAPTQPFTNDLVERAEQFCDNVPHRNDPFGRRNWGGPLHSLCSYQGKLKPSIAHFLIQWFTEPGWRILDPMAGVGTIPLEARRQGRTAISSDLSPLADCVSRAKLEPFELSEVSAVLDSLTEYISQGPPLSEIERWLDLDFGLNGPIRAYFHPETLREVALARQFFQERELPPAARDVVRSNVLHILHGNRPYALSRRSHPVTPFAPTGDFEYRPLLGRLTERLHRVVPVLDDLQRSSPVGFARQCDFRDLDIEEVDALITSPPFAKSFRFWSMNWMRLWFMGWDRDDFSSEPKRYLETEQRNDFSAYSDFAEAAHRVLRPSGLLILHLGETSSVNMADELRPILSDHFDIAYVGRESVLDTESHGLTDKGATVAHWYMFAVHR